MWFTFATKEKSGKRQGLERERPLWEQMGYSPGQECEDKRCRAGLHHTAGPGTGLLVSADPAWGLKFQSGQPGAVLCDEQLAVEQQGFYFQRCVQRGKASNS